jgi:NADH-quinone oxidoreductase subunit M
MLTAMFMLAMVAGIGLPGFSGFIGEFLSLVGTFVSRRPWAIAGAIGVIFAAVYMLWAFQRVFMGKPSAITLRMPDVSLREVIVVAPLLALSLFLGLYPKAALDRIEPSVKRTIVNVELKTGFHEKRPAGYSKTTLPKGVTASESIRLGLGGP